MRRFLKLKRVCSTSNHRPRISLVVDEIDFPFISFRPRVKTDLRTSEVDTQYLAPVRVLLPSHWEYHFLQGPLVCGPAPGMGEVYPGQTYNCWFHVPSLIEFQSVHEFLEEVIEEEGPFDVAWGFSAVRLTPKSHLVIHSYRLPRPLSPSSPSSSSLSPITYPKHNPIHKQRIP